MSCGLTRVLFIFGSVIVIAAGVINVGKEALQRSGVRGSTQRLGYVRKPWSDAVGATLLEHSLDMSSSRSLCESALFAPLVNLSGVEKATLMQLLWRHL